MKRRELHFLSLSLSKLLEREIREVGGEELEVLWCGVVVQLYELELL